MSPLLMHPIVGVKVALVHPEVRGVWRLHGRLWVSRSFIMAAGRLQLQQTLVDGVRLPEVQPTRCWLEWCVTLGCRC